MPTVEDAVVFLRTLADGEPRYSAAVKAAAGERGITPKQLWEAQSIVPVWYANTDTFPRHTVWWIGRRVDAEVDAGMSRQQLVSELADEIAQHFRPTTE
jgi:hypothetical protein